MRRSECEEITAKVKDGTYFEDARAWYFQKYVAVISERSYSFVIAGVSIFFLCISLLNISEVNKKHEKTPFIVYSDDTADYYSNLINLSKDNKGRETKTSPQLAVARYLISDYVNTREAYTPSLMDKDEYKGVRRKIKSSSSKNVLNEYNNYMNKINPYSPFVRFGDSKVRNIEILAIKMLTDDLVSGKAKVLFSAAVRDGNGGTKDIEKTYWVAVVNYRLPDIELISKTGAPLRFVVRYYKAKMLYTQKEADELGGKMYNIFFDNEK